MKPMKWITAAFLSTIMLSCSQSDEGTSNDCDSLAEATINAAQAYGNATDDNYVTRCNAYRAALEAEIENCNDVSGALQAQLNMLGDCSTSNPTGSSVSIMAGETRNYYNDVTVTVVGNIRKVRAERAGGEQWISFDVVSGATGTNAIDNFVFHIFDYDYTPLTEQNIFGTWSTNITVNNATNITGTFSGPVIVDTGDETQSVQVLYSGQIDVSF